MDKTITDTLVKRVKEFKNNPEKVQDYLDFVAKCPNYSYRNLLLIQSQYPSAKYVGSYNHFKDKGFHVMRGEKGIKIEEKSYIHLLPMQRNMFLKLFKALQKITT